MIGLKNDVVEIAEYDESWILSFENEKEAIEEALSSSGVCVEHIGSTAVTGLCAKPIIDILIGVGEFENGFACVKPLESIGYEFKGENGIPNRHFFVKGNPRTHHLHIVVKDGSFWVEHLLFRDHLRQHKDDRERYAALKRELASRFSNDRERYTDSKAGFIRNIIAKARKETHARESKTQFRPGIYNRKNKGYD